jgi:integrase
MCLANRKNTKGRAPIYVRITVDSKQVHLSTGEYIDPDDWDIKAGRVRGRGRKATLINDRLNKLFNKILKIRNDLESKDEEITAEAIKLTMTGKGKKQMTLMEAFDFHNLRIKGLIGTKYSQATYDIFERTKSQVSEYIQHQYGSADTPLQKLDHAFITGYDYYLRTERGNSNNTVYKNISRLNKIVNFSINHGWLKQNPFKNHKVAKVKKEIVFLDEEELKSIKEKQITIERLALVRDIFIFCCYTGLPYNEVYELEPSNITKGIDGEDWIVMTRKKTNKQIRIPLLPDAKELIEKYKKDPMAINRGKCFPVLSNQKMNAYLKEIADLCGIEKELTTHIARKTFSTTVTLLNDVPIETVSEVLGHSNIRITQEAYGKVVDKKISRDMKKLSQKLSQKTKTAKS